MLSWLEREAPTNFPTAGELKGSIFVVCQPQDWLLQGEETALLLVLSPACSAKLPSPIQQGLLELLWEMI